MPVAVGIVTRALKPLAVCAVMMLQACATGQYSHVAESEAGRRADEAERDRLLSSGALSPDMILVSGNALLPGAAIAGADLPTTGPDGSSPLVAPTLSAGGIPLLTLGGATRGGPLAGLGAGESASVPFGVGGASMAIAATAPLLGLGGASPGGALAALEAGGAVAVGGAAVSASASSSALLVDLATVAAKGGAGLLGPGGGVKPTPLAPTVPGAVPLTGAVKTVLTIPTGVLGH